MDHKDLLEILEDRFKKNPQRHPKISWERLGGYLKGHEEVLSKVAGMEESGGQPDFLDLEGQVFFVDMSPESPKGRRSICYDRKARMERKKNPPKRSAEEMAQDLGVALITEDLYRKVQELEDLDLKTSTWLATPEPIRKLGGAIFGDKRYGQTFVYHNGADAYYQARGARFVLHLPDWE